MPTLVPIAAATADLVVACYVSSPQNKYAFSLCAYLELLRIVLLFILVVCATRVHSHTLVLIHTLKHLLRPILIIAI